MEIKGIISILWHRWYIWFWTRWVWPLYATMSVMAGHPSGKSSYKNSSLHWIEFICLAMSVDEVSRGRVLEKATVWPFLLINLPQKHKGHWWISLVKSAQHSFILVFLLKEHWHVLFCFLNSWEIYIHIFGRQAGLDIATLFATTGDSCLSYSVEAH